MAARMKYAPAHSQMLDLAVVARREGLSFDEFWVRAVRPGRSPVTVGTEDPPRGAIRWPRDSGDRAVAITATNAARDGWRRAYEGLEPSGPERALALLSPWIDRLAETAGGRELVAA